MKYKKPIARIGSREEAIWTDVLREAEALLEQSKRNQTVQEGIIRLAKENIALEKEKFK